MTHRAPQSRARRFWLGDVAMAVNGRQRASLSHFAIVALAAIVAPSAPAFPESPLGGHPFRRGAEGKASPPGGLPCRREDFDLRGA